MDDPWGSPWASDPSSKTDHPPPSPLLSAQFLSPPPRAFFGSSPSLPASQSPWADDGGSGVWGSPSRGDVSSKVGDAADWGSWAEPSVSGNNPSRLDIPGKPSPLARPDAGSSPGLKPLHRARSPSSLRQYSPDPWATEPSWNERQDLSPVALAPKSPIFEPANKIGLGLKKGSSTPSLRLEAAKDDDVASHLDLQTSEPKDLAPAKVRAPKPASSSPSRGSTLDVDVPDSSPRASSTFSLDSSHARETDRQDSPITSIDEEARPRPEPGSRQSSGKVQQLVGKYHELEEGSKRRPALRDRNELPTRSVSRDVSPSQPPGENDEVSKSRQDDYQDDPSFGDFEESGQIFDEPLAASTTESLSSDRSATPKATESQCDPVLEDKPESKPESKPEEHDPKDTEAASSPGSNSVTSPVQEVINKYGPITFDVPVAALDDIFKNTVPAAEYAEGLSDRLVTDSFGSISERKTWYRVSRYGSMRKHDSGDDENYHPVSWRTCDVHGQTINIVRRWMEEDSYSGRPTLGRGKRTGVFNWESTDAKDSPMDLSALFARKSTSHSKTASIPSAIHNATPSIHSFGSSAAPAKGENQDRSTAAVTTPTAIPASFGWNSPSSKSVTSNPSPAAIPPPGPVSSVQKSQTAAFRASAPTPLALGSASNFQTTPAAENEDEDEDDEDWGDMVTSPTKDADESLDSPVTLSQVNKPASQTYATPLGTPTADGNNSKMAVSGMRTAPSSAGMAAVSLTPSPPPETSFNESTYVANEGSSGQLSSTVASSSEPGPPKDSIASVMPLSTGAAAIMQNTPDTNAHDDEVVQSVVAGLPDLSYMLHD